MRAIIVIVCVVMLTGCAALQSASTPQDAAKTERGVVVCDRDSVSRHCHRMSEEQYQAMLRNMSRPSTGSNMIR